MTATRPDGLSISAIVCTRGRAEMLPDCLASLVAGLRDGDELIVVESGEGGAEQAIQRLGSPDPNVVHIRVDRPGKCHQLNLGIRAARGDVLLLTDDDVRVDPDWPDAMAAPFQDLAVGIVCGRIRGLTNAPGFGPAPDMPTGEAPYETWTFAHGAAMAVRTIAAFEAGGFDERLGPGRDAVGEDHDFLLRVRERAWRIEVSDAVPAQHLEWRSEDENLHNALAYERGAGAVVAAAVRRSRQSGYRLTKSRLLYQWQMLTHNPPFGTRALVSFTGGFLYGLRLGERDWLDDANDHG